jgi:segregation and condensation protein A
VAGVLARLVDQAGRRVSRITGPDQRYAALTPDLLDGVSPERLRQAFLRASAPKPIVRVELDHVGPIRVTVGEAMEEIVDELRRAGRMTFRRLTDGLVERIEVIVRFLAVLEMFKQGLVEIDQAETFGEIVICWLGADVDARVSAGLIDDYEG